MKKSLRILLMISTALFSQGCQNIEYQAYSNDLYSFEYPNNYTVETLNTENNVLTIKGEKGRVEIFNSKNGDPLHGYSSSGLDEYESKLVPKEKLKSGDYSIWLFYKGNDEQIKKEVQMIYNSFRIK